MGMITEKAEKGVWCVVVGRSASPQVHPLVSVDGQHHRGILNLNLFQPPITAHLLPCWGGEGRREQRLGWNPRFPPTPWPACQFPLLCEGLTLFQSCCEASTAAFLLKAILPVLTLVSQAETLAGSAGDPPRALGPGADHVSSCPHSPGRQASGASAVFFV